VGVTDAGCAEALPHIVPGIEEQSMPAWSCARCTYLNPPAYLACDMCGCPQDEEKRVELAEASSAANPPTENGHDRDTGGASVDLISPVAESRDVLSQSPLLGALDVEAGLPEVAEDDVSVASEGSLEQDLPLHGDAVAEAAASELDLGAQEKVMAEEAIGADEVVEVEEVADDEAGSLELSEDTMAAPQSPSTSHGLDAVEPESVEAESGAAASVEVEEADTNGAEVAEVEVEVQSGAEPWSQDEADARIEADSSELPLAAAVSPERSTEGSCDTLLDSAPSSQREEDTTTMHDEDAPRSDVVQRLSEPRLDLGVTTSLQNVLPGALHLRLLVKV
jgi:hypothetical protein